MQALDTTGGQGLGLAQLGAAQAHGAGGHLAARDVDALVGLGVGAQVDALGLGQFRHERDVAVQGVQLDHQHRGVQRLARPLAAQQVPMQADVI